MQQYKDRDPKWIKLDRELLNNYEFTRLSDACKYHVIALRLLVAQVGNKIANDPEWIKSRISATDTVDIQLLIESGFLEPYDGSEHCVRNCTELYTEKSKEKKNKEEDSKEDNNNYTEIKDYWNSKGNLPAIRSLTKSRCLQLAVRLKENGFGSQWRKIIDIISDTPFCCGTNDRGWTANFDWLIKNDSNYTKVLEGTYGASKPQSQPQQTMESQWEQRQGNYIRTAPVEQIKQTEAHNLQNPAFRAWAEKVRPELKEAVL